MEFFLDLGCDVNAGPIIDGVETDDGPLVDAVGDDHLEIVRLLLSRGANPLIGRPAVAAACLAAENALAILKLLEEHGVNLHKIFPFGNDLRPINALSMARAYTKPEVVDYLLARGARMPEAYSTAEIAAYFQEEGIFKSPPTDLNK